MFGLSDNAFKTVEKLVLLPIKKAGGLVWVFGSRARGDHSKYSDLDLLYSWEGLPAGSAPPDASLIRKIKDSLEESSLPIKVDLVNISELAEGYRASVLKDRRTL